MESQLTGGAIATLMQGGEVSKPIFQVLGFKKIAGQNGSDRYRMNISDGVNSHTFAMLATQLNDLIPDGKIDHFCIFRAEKLISNAVSEKRVLIILDLTILATGSEIGVKYGNPVPWNEHAATQPVAAPKVNGSGPTPAKQPALGGVSSPSFYGGRSTATSNGYTKQATSSPNMNTSFDMSGENCVPIQDLSPYNSRCTIKARITNKPPVRTWSNSRGEGKLFSIDLLDDSGEIRMTGFNQAVDQFYDMLQVNNVYYFSRFSVKSARKEFSSIAHDYELSMNNDTQIVPCKEKSNDIPMITFNFTPIGQIENVEKDTNIDVIGVCKNVGELVQFTSRNGKELKKKDITLVDQSNKEINLTLWGAQAEEFMDDTNPVVALKGVKVSDFSGRSLSCLNSSLLQVNPDLREAHALRGWYDNEGVNMESTSLTQQRGQSGNFGGAWKLIREAKNMDVGADMEKGVYFMNKVTVMSIKRDNAMYKACSTANCNKKVIDQGDGTFRCEKCNKSDSSFKWRVLLSVGFGDCSDVLWATCFQEHAETILGKKCEELGQIYSHEQDAFDSVIKEACFKNYIVKFRSKVETYNSETRQKHVVMDLSPVNYAEYCKKLASEIKESFS